MLEARQLTKRYKDTTALDALNLEVGSGEIFCLLGANGAGKTTTINLFLDFLKPDSGAAFIDGLNVQEQPRATKAKLAYLPEDLRLYPQLSGLENLIFFASLNGKSPSNDDGRKMLSAVGLAEDAFDKRVAQYSKGMRQKVGLAVALAKSAQLLLLDEPLSGLDPKASSEFGQKLSMLRDQGTAVLMATHDLFRAKEVADRIGIMKRGQLVETVAAESMSANDLENLYLQHMHE